jgi:hypothetical protein
MKALEFVGYAWCVAVIVAYLAYSMLSEHVGSSRRVVLAKSGLLRWRACPVLA